MFKKIMSIVNTFLIVLVGVLVILLVGLRFVGLTPYTVLSGSMEPKYHVGSVIYVIKVSDPETLEVGMPLTYVLEGTTVTHQIVDKGTDERGLYFVTQGIYEGSRPDPKVYPEQIVGKPVFTIPYLGYVSHFVQNPPGIYVTIACCALLIIFCFLPDLLCKKEAE